MSQGKKHRRWIALLSAAALAVVGGTFIPVSAAVAWTTTGCKWNGPTVTWNASNMSGGTYLTTAKAAATSWASRTDVNGMGTNSSAGMYAYPDNLGANGYDGWTSWNPWNCSGGMLYWGSNVTINPYYTDAFSANKKTAIWVHEFGHGLGLNHGPSNAIMYTCPACTYNTYGYYYPVSDDIAGMNYLY